ncbi:hypothetical protein [Paracoccus actinidiae]|uniref:hypothetical protein n=1 Tax=Paracoccus actinidiae TaxID=3064531 RepID=UPI0027D29893|nr:hypothetical protein [Paracoccus sp. M09]
MDIRALCAAAAVAVGVGQAAEAATLDVTFEITSLELFCETGGDCSDEVEPVVTDFMGMPLFTLMTGVLTLPDPIASPSGVPFAEGLISFLTQGISYELGYFIQEDEDKVYREEFPFWDYRITFQDGIGELFYRDDDYPFSVGVEGVFTPIELAPVPLPATAALLPMGLGALAMMRRRRRT